MNLFDDLKKPCWKCGKRFWFRKNLTKHLAEHILAPMRGPSMRQSIPVPYLHASKPVREETKTERHYYVAPRDEDFQITPLAVDPEPAWSGSGGAFSGGGASGGWDSPDGSPASTESSSSFSSSDSSSSSSSDCSSAGTDGTSGGI